LVLLLAGCDAVSPPDPEVDRQAIETVIRSYLPELAKAYATGDRTGLRGLAVDKEIATVSHKTELLANEGKVYEPELKELVIEDVKVWQYANAFATTVETWDVRSYAIGSHTLLSEVLGQKNRVKYQLKRKDEGWVILYRELIKTFD
jgi:hypothetical protein